MALSFTSTGVQYSPDTLLLAAGLAAEVRQAPQYSFPQIQHTENTDIKMGGEEGKRRRGRGGGGEEEGEKE